MYKANPYAIFVQQIVKLNVQGQTLSKIDEVSKRIMKQSSVEGNTMQSTIEGITMQSSAEGITMQSRTTN